MQFTIEREPLFKVLSDLQSIVEKKSAVQILSNILCQVKGSELSLLATDLEVGMKCTLAVDSPKDGKLTLSAKHFFEIVRELPNKKLTVVKKENNWVELTCGKSKFNVVSLSAEEFPNLPVFEEKNYIETRPDAFLDMIQRTEFAVSTDATRYHMNGVFFEAVNANVFRMAATDGHRLSIVDSEIFSQSPEIKRGIIIPRKGISELKKILESETGSFELAFERGQIFAKTGNKFLSIRLIEGEYPDYRVVLPKELKLSITLNRDNFTHALKRVSLLAHEKSRAVKLAIQPGILVITSNNPEMGEAREELDIEYSGEALEVGFNSKFFLDCLGVLQGDKVVLRLKDRLSPGTLQGSDELNHTTVIMPMRI